MKNFGEKEAWAYPGTAQNFWVPPIIPGTCKAMDFKFDRTPVHSEGPSKQNPSKNFWVKGAWAYPGTVQFFRVPPIISGTEFTFGQYIHRIHRNKSPSKIFEKRERGRIQGLPILFGYPRLSPGRVKLWNTNFVHTFILSIGTKAHLKFREK